VKFIVDAQLPPALALALRDRGVDAVAVRDIGLREADDPGIWNYAIENDAAIISKDEDFAERFLSGAPAPIVIWLRIGNTSNRNLLAWLMPSWPEIAHRIEAGDRLVEVRERISTTRSGS
jgi:predicted nuclease of predicted toxin-antitoxin system